MDIEPSPDKRRDPLGWPFGALDPSYVRSDIAAAEIARLQALVDALAGALGDAMAQIRVSPTLARHPENADVLLRGAAALAAVGR